MKSIRLVKETDDRLGKELEILEDAEYFCAAQLIEWARKGLTAHIKELDDKDLSDFYELPIEFR